MKQLYELTIIFNWQLKKIGIKQIKWYAERFLISSAIGFPN